jgi:hypothetical protein
MHSVLVDGGFYEVDGANLAGLHFSVTNCFVMFGRRGDVIHRHCKGNGGERSAARCAGLEDVRGPSSHGSAAPHRGLTSDGPAGLKPFSVHQDLPNDVTMTGTRSG